MFTPESLGLLCCPETQQKLCLADEQLISVLNQKISGGSIINRAGQKIAEPLEGGLLRADGKVLYPLRDGIPLLLIPEAIVLSAL